MTYEYTIRRISMMNLLTETYTNVYEETYPSLNRVEEEFPSFCPPPTFNSEYPILKIRWDKVHSSRRDMLFKSQSELLDYLLENQDCAVIEGVVCSEGTVIYNAIKIIKIEVVYSTNEKETPSVPDWICETETPPTVYSPPVRLDV